MSKLILSDECFNIDYDFFSNKIELFSFDYYITDGIFIIDTMKMNCVKEHTVIDVPITQINHLKKLISKENLKEVLKTENEVSFSNISLYNYTLATDYWNHLRGNKPLSGFLTKENLDRYISQFVDVVVDTFNGNEYIKGILKTIEKAGKMGV